MTPWTKERARGDTSVEAGPLEEFIEFRQAGAPSAGHYACVTCGGTVTIVGRLPSCRECGGTLWGPAETSPFAGRPTRAAPQEVAWHDEEALGLARLVRGVWYALGVAAAFWLVLAVGFAYSLTVR